MDLELLKFEAQQEAFQSICKRGCQRYLEFQFHSAGDFATVLFRAIEQADDNNLALIAMGFPGEVLAYRMWTRVGSDAVIKEAGEDHWVVMKIRDGTFGH